MKQESPKDDGNLKNSSSPVRRTLLTRDERKWYECAVLDSLLTLYNNIVRKGYTHSQTQRLLSRLVSNITSPIGLDFAIFIGEVGATAIPEVVDRLEMNWASATRVVNKWVQMGLLRNYGIVRPPYSIRQGKRVQIYGLLNALPEQAIEAQIRYAKIRQPSHKLGNILDELLIYDVIKNFENHTDPTGRMIKAFIIDRDVAGSEVQEYVEVVIERLKGHGVRVFK